MLVHNVELGKRQKNPEKTNQRKTNLVNLENKLKKVKKVKRKIREKQRKEVENIQVKNIIKKVEVVILNI